MSEGASAVKLKPAAIEAANRAEATSLLIRCGYRVYRPEADVAGEDLVVRTPAGDLNGVQLKSRVLVDWKKYGGIDLLMLFPADKFVPEKPRPWFLIPHDTLFAWVKDRHGMAKGWTDSWSYPGAGKDLQAFLAPYQVRPPAELAIPDSGETTLN